MYLLGEGQEKASLCIYLGKRVKIDIILFSTPDAAFRSTA
jgi:hypothetical protein